MPQLALIILFLISNLQFVERQEVRHSVSNEIIIRQTEQITDNSYELEVFVSFYCTCDKCCGEWSDGLDYLGQPVVANQTIAVDPDWIPLNSKVEFIDIYPINDKPTKTEYKKILFGNTYIPTDIGGDINGARIDIMEPSNGKCIKNGVLYALVKVTPQ